VESSSNDREEDTWKSPANELLDLAAFKKILALVTWRSLTSEVVFMGLALLLLLTGRIVTALVLRRV
jgi:hypothetical protein